MINTRREREIIRMTYKTPIYSVLMNRARLVMVLESAIYVYDISNMKLVQVISATTPNPKGICEGDNCESLAYFVAKVLLPFLLVKLWVNRPNATIS